MGIRFLIAAMVSSVVFDATASADIVLNHQPQTSGGSSADTEMYDNFGDPYWQRSADEVVLAAPAELNRITWWGYYRQDNPPSEETIRFRFYGARGDGLPNESNILFEEFAQNPTRTATGRRIAVSVLPHEYFYEFNLSATANLNAGTPYWLEIAQIGDLETRFEWEDSVTTRDGFAFKNPATVDWRHTINSPNTLAFQLYAVPEPSTGLMLGIAYALIHRRRRRRR